MDGVFEYLDSNFNIRTAWNSNDIPMDAVEVLMFHVDGPKHPNTAEDLARVLEIQSEFARIRKMIHGDTNWYDVEEEEDEPIDEMAFDD